MDPDPGGNFVQSGSETLVPIPVYEEFIIKFMSMMAVMSSIILVTVMAVMFAMSMISNMTVMSVKVLNFSSVLFSTSP